MKKRNRKCTTYFKLSANDNTFGKVIAVLLITHIQVNFVVKHITIVTQVPHSLLQRYANFC